ncbi:MAG: ion channel [Candidatus Competibacteraceae bacterium]|nr:ion channel [Candidatus Competibacteraceae bacterium]
MSFFHAFYFISYTATTIGFGEIPNAFSESQRMWVTLCIYLSVIGWAYSIGALLALLQDQNFRNAVRLQRFAGRCGICGNRSIWSAATAKPGS